MPYRLRAAFGPALLGGYLKVLDLSNVQNRRYTIRSGQYFLILNGILSN